MFWLASSLPFEWRENRCGNLRVLLGECLVELLDVVQQNLQLVYWWQNGHSGWGKRRKKGKEAHMKYITK